VNGGEGAVRKGRKNDDSRIKEGEGVSTVPNEDLYEKKGGKRPILGIAQRVWGKKKEGCFTTKAAAGEGEKRKIVILEDTGGTVSVPRSNAHFQRYIA